MSFWKQAWELQLKIAGAYNPDEDYTGKYMTAFYFEDSHGIPHCHCTHKYFGEMTLIQSPRSSKSLTSISRTSSRLNAFGCSIASRCSVLKKIPR